MCSIGGEQPAAPRGALTFLPANGAAEKSRARFVACATSGAEQSAAANERARSQVHDARAENNPSSLPSLCATRRRDYRRGANGDCAFKRERFSPDRRRR